MGLEGSMGFGEECSEAEGGLEVEGWVRCCCRRDGVVGGGKSIRPCKSVRVGWGTEEDEGEVCKLNM